MAVESGHAPHTSLYHFASGKVTKPWDCLSGKRLQRLKEGKTFAFLIDLLSDDGETVFRIHYQDAASEPPLGFPPPRVLEERDVDLAILCMPGYWMVNRYPEGILGRTGARHVLVIHYEDFFRSRDKPVRFVPRLTNNRANRFMERLRDEVSRSEHESLEPAPAPCGPGGPAWTLPLPGEWLRFRVQSDDDEL
jgi:hypothetical protein